MTGAKCWRDGTEKVSPLGGKREESSEKREERREKREEGREKRAEVPREAARGPRIRPQEVPKEVPSGLWAS